MPYFKYTTQTQSPRSTMIHYYWEVASGGIESPSTICTDEDPTKGQISSCLYKSKYETLTPSLKSCLDYCAFLCSMYLDCLGVMLEKERIVSLIVAEGLLEENDLENDSCLEEVASSLIDELIDCGILLQNVDSYQFRPKIEIREAYYKLCIVEKEEEHFVAISAHTPIRVSIHPYYGTDISPYLKNLPIHSLFVSSGYVMSFDEATMDTICGLKSLLVLHWNAWANDGISFRKMGELINLKLFSLAVLNLSLSSENTPSLSNFQQLQTLELSLELNDKIIEEVATIKTLRHHLCDEFRPLKGIGRLVNLQTLIGLDVRSEVVDELSSLNQLRRLHVQVADENIEKLLETITAMKKLIYLCLIAESSEIEKYGCIFPLLEPFSPPPGLQELYLYGTLMELPDWITSMENLTALVLCDSNLTSDPSILQFLPNLKFLCLDNAYVAEFIGKEFCDEGGFPKLEILEIRSKFLVSWSEIVEGAFPSLTIFRCYSKKMRSFPEGIQHFSKLETLRMVVHEDLIRRLNGDENYKIKHIPSVFMSSKSSPPHL